MINTSDRRQLLALATRLLLGSAASVFKKSQAQQQSSDRACEGEWEYVVVGSGAGGGTLAARLVQLGHSVLVLEAGGTPLEDSSDTTKSDYEVPAFHPKATENQALEWDFFVRHYGSLEQQKLDPKYRESYQGDSVQGVLYPRASALGGCTAHNAMIMICPSNEDWSQLARMIGDQSWAPEQMRRFFERAEDCRYRPLARLLSKTLGWDGSKHGFRGWLDTEEDTMSDTLLKDKDLLKTILRSWQATLKALGNDEPDFVTSVTTLLDTNDWSVERSSPSGVASVPTTTYKRTRRGTCERLIEVRNRYPERLHIQTNALVTRILFDSKRRAAGVEFQNGVRLYRTHGQPREEGVLKTACVTKEVILSGGTFNTPQLLMLSGIGPSDQLSKWDIPPVKTLAGVGRNLQDRYEVGVVSRLKEEWQSLVGVTYTDKDAAFASWRDHRSGIYSSNGVILGINKRSTPQRVVPDLFCYALLGDFRGYFPNYSEALMASHSKLTWAILKSHTQNEGGEITLKSRDPRIAPEVNFRYFEEGTDKTGDDLDSVVEGIRFVRKLGKNLDFVDYEEYPGPQLETQYQLEEFVRSNAWGHHASCSCKIGKEEQRGVLTPDFKVHGVTSLRVVDASVFPKIPGSFIVSAVYMVGEKAAEVIHRDAGL